MAVTQTPSAGTSARSLENEVAPSPAKGETSGRRVRTLAAP